MCISPLPTARIFSLRSVVVSCYRSLSIGFFGLCRARPDSGLRPLTQVRGCTTFVIDLRWPRCSTGTRAGKDVDNLMPVLSTYLGHTCIRDTYWYLSACPELMEHATRRLEKHWEALP